MSRSPRRSSPTDLDHEAALAFRGLARGPVRWLWDHYPLIVEARRLGGRTDWQSVAEVMEKDGVRSKSGEKLKPASIRRAFARVVKKAEASGHPGMVQPVAHPTREVKPGTRAKPMVRQLPAAEAEAEPTTVPPAKPHWTDP